MKTFLLFHCNLMFSSIEEKDRKRVIDCCYWPLLHWVKESKHPVAIEMTILTVESIHAIDPSWVSTAQALIAEGNLELVGSGYAQIIGPLVPAEVSRKNILLAKKGYQKYFYCQPRLWLPNELCVSAGLLALYQSCGIEAVFLEQENHRFLFSGARPEQASQSISLNDTDNLQVIWVSSTAFQKMQRFVHGEIDARNYWGWLEHQAGTTGKDAICLYANDAEVFNFRPGRYAGEQAILVDEWQRFSELCEKVEKKYPIVKPSSLLDVQQPPTKLSANIAHPIAVKKQEKYNVSRWAVSGRDDLTLNTLCQQLYQKLLVQESQVAALVNEEQWKNLLLLWSSDYRTHITAARWQALLVNFKNDLLDCKFNPSFLESKGTDLEEFSIEVQEALPQVRQEQRLLIIETPQFYLALNKNKGLAIHQYCDRQVAAMPLFGTVEQGRIDDYRHNVDYFSGHWVYDIPFRDKLTDLVKCEPRIARTLSAPWLITFHVELDTSLGSLSKVLQFNSRSGQIHVAWDVSRLDLQLGVMRYGFLTLFTEQFEETELNLKTHNGGESLEHFPLGTQAFDHGTPVPYKTSCLTALGVTEGYMEVGDQHRQIIHGHDNLCAKSVGMASSRRAGSGVLCRTWFSGREIDETAKYDRQRMQPSAHWLVSTYRVKARLG